ncbi:NOL1/NOP2/Sun family protein [Heterostelium album PN500]|uniref:NOL1/NOP2/Sun family protein n=1 Tax=Heterostelium pallidum (strain ATCC 26659 / Pp 5 / PN500) TaxID=670386 RepID=D3AVU8_HETP5|nr:NOL1/NOP2/Sun family protein [Heterostelium album PN500]EFA86421.1 NOL1/NOP2/Sun family protein [Heterostelium album PN500]|eukprot:XP_020438526.1 NOL1/NOP2/Sun family protein [Heterostelium album PN500]
MVGKRKKSNNNNKRNNNRDRDAAAGGNNEDGQAVKKTRTDGTTWDKGTNPRTWSDIVAKNEQFEDYYKKMNIITNEDEWKQFMEALGKPLPTTFRINTSIGETMTQIVRDQLAQVISKLPKEVEIDGQTFTTLSEIEWYPDHLGWHSSLPKKAFRKNTVLEEFHQFLMHHSEQGNLTRQETVSMIPPVFMDVKPEHVVLDMCAAPGSKTTQLIESIHQGLSEKSVPTGVVIANDVDTNRCYMLVHQTARLGSPAIVITNHEAQHFPLLNLGAELGGPLLFDRILADVPCSGDGTMRKNPDLWARWKNHFGSALHPLQLQIAVRAANLLKVGGRMVYSTCSLNPIENEAVVAALIARSEGSMRIVDVSAMHPALKRAQGLHSWPVVDKETGELYSSWESVAPTKKARIHPSFFPPTKEFAESIGLQNCMRVYPHLQDTGGFFITVLEKVSEFPNQIGKRLINQAAANTSSTTTTTTTNNTESTSTESPVSEESTATESPVAEESTTTTTTEKKEKEKKPAYQKFFEEPFNLLSEQDRKDIGQVADFYGLNEFPIDNLLTRSEKSAKLYLASKPIMNIIKGDTQRRLKIINAGLKSLQKHDGLGMMQCPYRVSQDAINWVEPFMTKRVVELSHEELLLIIRVTEPMFTDFRPELTKLFESLDPGCFVIKITGEDTHTRGMKFCVWRGKRSIHLLVQKQEIQSLANILKVKIEKQKGVRNHDDSSSTVVTDAVTTDNDQKTLTTTTLQTTAE